MDRVYIVHVEYEYEGAGILGIFTTKAQAEHVAAQVTWGDEVYVKAYKLNRVDRRKDYSDLGVTTE